MAMRSARPEDAAALAALWSEAGLHFKAEYVAQELQSALARNPDLVIVDDGGSGSRTGLAGSVFGTFDGRRGWLNRLAASTNARRQGIGTALVHELERRLRAMGCVKINLLIEPDNAAVVPFYERLDFRSRRLTFMEKWIAGPWEHPASGPADSGQHVWTDTAPDVWTGIEPALHPEPYVYVTVPEPPPGIRPFASIQEDEGLTLVVTRDQADRAGLPYEYTAARVTLTIGSSLSAVGLTARVSQVLAGAGISCNVIAGFRHDHLFVDWDRGPDAEALLRRL
jgi:uncharacterized protein